MAVASVMILPLQEPVCDARQELCVRLYAAATNQRAANRTAASGPPVASWTRGKWLLGYYRTLLEGSCTHRDGQRKVVVEVGAGIGALSVYLAKRGCYVHAVDAMPAVADALRRSVEANALEGLLFVHSVAVAAASSRQVRVRYTAADLTTAHVAHAALRKPSPAHAWATTRVRSTTLDSFVMGGSVGWAVPPHHTVDLLRVDTYGTELEVLQSGRQLLNGGVSRVSVRFDPRRTPEQSIRAANALLEESRFVPRFYPRLLPPWSWDGLVRQHRTTDIAVYALPREPKDR